MNAGTTLFQDATEHVNLFALNDPGPVSLSSDHKLHLSEPDRHGAHRLRILYRAKPDPMMSATYNDFLLVHVGYEALAPALLADNVSLMGFSASHALFAVVPEDCNVFDSKNGKFSLCTDKEESRFQR